MRCNNCGFNNPADRMRCEKCNAPLKGSMVDQGQNENNQTSDGLAGTIKGNQVKADPWDCPQCSRPVIPGSGACNKCGYNFETGSTIPSKEPEIEPCKYGVPVPPAEKENELPSFRKQGLSPKMTIDPYQKGFKLQPVATNYENEFEEVKIRAVSDTVKLGRDDIDPENSTISSKQAVMVNKNGKWYIKDESSHKTTFVYAKDYIELQDGDIIMMGNRKFIFST